MFLFYIFFIYFSFSMAMNGYNARKNRKKYNSNCKTIILVGDCCWGGWGCFFNNNNTKMFEYYLTFLHYCKGIMCVCVNDWARKKKNLSKTIINLSIFIVLSMLFLHYNNDITLERKKRWKDGALAPIKQKKHYVQHDLILEVMQRGMWRLRGFYIKEQFITLTNYGSGTICLTSFYCDLILYRFYYASKLFDT